MGVILKDEERLALCAWTRRGSGQLRQGWRASIILSLASGKSVSATSRELGFDRNTVRLWRNRFIAGGITGLASDAARPGRPKTIPKDRSAAVLTLTRMTTPENATHWSVRTMAEVSGVSPASVQRIWAANGIKPHLVRSFKLSKDPQFEEKLVDVVGLYLNPPEKALVLCVDEKSQIQALDRTQKGLPMKKGRFGTMTHDYKRNGKTTLFAALDALGGSVIGSCKDRHRHQLFLYVLWNVKTFQGMNMQHKDNPTLWTESIFDAKGARFNGILKRSIKSVEEIASVERLINAARSRGFHIKKTPTHFLIFCSSEVDLIDIC